MDDHYIYVFVRQDFSLAEQFLDGMHAIERLATLQRYSEQGIPNAVLIGLPHEKSLKRAQRYVSGLQFPHVVWIDPDKGTEYRSLAVGPVSPERKQLFQKYVLYSPGAPKGACLLTEDGGAKADVAQLPEHSVFNGEVAAESNPLGGNPAVGSINCS
jgi:hypothetical protein